MKCYRITRAKEAKSALIKGLGTIDMKVKSSVTEVEGEKSGLQQQPHKTIAHWQHLQNQILISRVIGI